MKHSPQKLLVIAAILGATSMAGMMPAHAQQTATAIQSVQPDSIVQITADGQGLAQVSPAALPRAGTFWVIVPGYAGNVTALPYPCMPGSPAGLPVYDITGNIFLVDDTGGQVFAGRRLAGTQASTAMISSALESQASTVANLIEQIQGVAASQQMQAMDGMEPPGGGSGGGTNDYEYTFTPPVYTTNDLWLQMVGTTNNGTGMTAYLVINTPWNVTNGIYDLFATTNLAPSAWQWLGRCSPGQTNLTVVNLASPTEFFILGLTNDTDGDGLTDAYENLVSHTSPTNAYSNLDGLPDSWEASLGLNPQNNNVTMPSERSNYGYNGADWLNGVTGVKSGTINLDNEGNVLTVSQ